MHDQPVTRFVRLDTSGGDGRTLYGLAVPFNTPTRIDTPQEGRFDEQFVAGSFRRSLGRRTPKLQFEHGTHPLFGSLPIGEFRSIKETERGLEFEARIFDAEFFAPLREAVASEAIDGVSIRFRPLEIHITEPRAREDVEDADTELRTVAEAELIELGPVIFPAYPTTQIDLRNIDPYNKNDRRRLFETLIGVGVTTRGERDTESGTESIEPQDSPASSVTGLVSASPVEQRQSLSNHERWFRRWISEN